MAFYDVQGQTILSHGPNMLHDMDNMFTDSMLDSMLESNLQGIAPISYSENNYPQTFAYTEVFRASDMNTATPCVNGVQHFSSPPLSPPVTPDTDHDDHADEDSDCTSCVKCRQSATQKRAKRREQNRQSQRKFRARKEAKLSDAKSRIRDLEALVKAQEKTNIELKLTIEELNSRQSMADTSARRMAMARATKQVSARTSEVNNRWKRTAEDHRGPILWTERDDEPPSYQESGREK